MNTPSKEHGIRYPWREWFAKAVKEDFTVRKGVHFTGMVHGMAQTARQAAKRLGIRITVSIGEDFVSFRVVRDGK